SKWKFRFAPHKEIIMRKLLKLFWIFALGTGLCWTQVIPALLTGGFNNGRLWESFDEGQRLMYASGIGEGIRLAVSGMETCTGYKAKEDRYDFGEFSVGDVVHEMTVLFTDREN